MPGLAHKISQTIAAAGADLSFFVAQAIGRRYSAVIAFATEDDARKAATLIKTLEITPAVKLLRALVGPSRHQVGLSFPDWHPLRLAVKICKFSSEVFRFFGLI